MLIHQSHNSRGNYNYNICTYQNTRWNPHFHKNFEFIFVDKGEIFVSLNGKNYTLPENKAMLILSNQIHSFTVPEDSIATVTVFSEEYVPKFSSKMKGFEAEYPIFCLDESVFSLFKKRVVDKTASILMRKACFYAICDEYISQTKLIKRSDLAGETPIIKIIDWIELHCTEDISLSDVAEVFGYEYHYLSRLLNKNYNISFTDLLNGYRVERAAEMLKDTSLPITEVALKSGFQSIRNFNLVFKTSVGISPKDFRM